ncbi:hypothetical protein SeMB42_g03679 [Synchytrium endobioticum]|uniref:Uncharacterized protein n=1 Tax=Synchytrium endobioticum TaxID=286115 RepID=A0A507D540_9FUNG|nr:hypothetical protein SeMB42_g03679 [Synchytrium endobioticum]
MFKPARRTNIGSSACMAVAPVLSTLCTGTILRNGSRSRAQSVFNRVIWARVDGSMLPVFELREKAWKWGNTPVTRFR